MGAGASVQSEFEEARNAAKTTFNNKDTLKKLWSTLDFNGNGIVSLAEIDKMVVWLCETDAYGGFFRGMNNKPALMRAYKRTINREGDGDPWVEKPEFTILLRNLYLYNQLWAVFDEIDTADDRRIDLNEFKLGLAKLGFELDDATATAEFDKMDKNDGGQVLFDEFCTYCMNAMEMGDDAITVDFTAEDEVTGDNAPPPAAEGDAAAAAPPAEAAPAAGGSGDVIAGVNFAESRRIAKETFGNKDVLTKLWATLDFNGNGKVSLAEIDKMVVWLEDTGAYNDFFRGMNNKPALMRAYKRTTVREGDGDAWVEKPEFTILLRNLHLYTDLWRVFDNIDTEDDRRVDIGEFKAGMARLGEEMDDATAEAEFDKMDKNDGGQVLFDEFCTYYMNKMEMGDEGLTEI